MSQDIRMCFVGDSFVVGVGDETMLGWAGRLCADIDQSCLNITYYNLGVKSDTSRHVLSRWQRECLPRLPSGCDARVIFSLGVGDALTRDDAQGLSQRESRENIRQILHSARLQYRVLMVGPPPVADAEHNRHILEISKIFGEEAEAAGIPYIPLFAKLADDNHYRHETTRFDRLHPRSGGYAKMAKIISNSRQWWFHRTRAACEDEPGEAWVGE